MKLRIRAFVAAVLSLGAGLVHAQLPPAVAPDKTPADSVQPALVAPADSPAAPLDAADVAAYVDGVVAAYRRRLGIEGVTVAVVDARRTLLLRGYGLAAQRPERRVDPSDTLFRIGSVSKTFTYLEALRLADAGKLKLDAPVNDYLPPALQLPADGFKPVLVRHLLTHSAGYEDSALGHLFARSPQAALSLQEYLVEHRPARVRDVDVHAVYSNYSVALLGALLAQVEGLPFEALTERDLFAPLGMSSTTFREPLQASDPRNAPATLQARWSSGFVREAGGVSAKPFEYIAQIAPAGSVSSTAADMSRYLRMLLNRGELDGQRILPAGVFDRLEQDAPLRNAADATGFSHGFFRRRYGEVQSFEHGGATLYFHSYLMVVPELGFGVFVSTNTDSGRRLAAELPQMLVERYFPRARPAALPVPAADFARTGQEYAGTYLGERRNYGNFEKLLIATNAQVGITADGYLTLSSGEETSRWVLEKPDVFRAVQGSDRLSFLRDGSGKVTGFVSPGGHDVFDRVGLFGNKNNFFLLLGLAGLSAAGVLFGQWQRRRGSSVSRATFSARWLGLTAASWLLFLVLFGLGVAQLGDEAVAIFDYPTGLLRLALWLVVPALLLTVLCVVLLPRAWAAAEWNRWRKLRHSAAVLAFVLAGISVWLWNAVGWRL
ncbi:CubicO group peptidase (beta-lactamase class C family) [Tahibacter aquaticus]|uniref:CubicO group peptidase (Beta-lactamase class C family) n=1 Tax=Tahibacter aquaticus TaxID=520092 RepID=A0A4R6YHR5_9GAMM|nr:serine hydrolase domain-containing protein [Tahibacter aquaticus]TDR36263.1 CubicO group peptidase (beta-lactamase class C family) [Tahibacter aquaticus]